MINVCADLFINEDGKFVDSLQVNSRFTWRVTKYLIFLNLIVKKEIGLTKLGKLLRKYITNVSNNADLKQKHKRNIFDILENT